MHGIRPPGGVYCHVAGCDLVRDADGTWKVLEDNVRTPSGISYVLENRVAMTRLVPAALQRATACARSTTTRSCCSRALRAVAPAPRARRRSSSGRPGRSNSAYFEHAFLARQMGVELVEASDLVVRDDVLYMRTTRGPARASTRSTGASTTTSSTRSSSAPTRCSACPGLVRAYRAGTVAIANAFGTGVADDKAVYHYVPEMIRYYLGEEPILENVPTYLLSDPEQREDVLGRLDELVVKPTGESRRQGRLHRPARADEAELERARRRDPRATPSAGSPRSSSTSRRCRPPARDGALAPRHVDLRPFAVFGERHQHRPRRPDARRDARRAR